jgi:hypothetical protein
MGSDVVHGSKREKYINGSSRRNIPLIGIVSLGFSFSRSLVVPRDPALC